jgi:hypothetical protein
VRNEVSAGSGSGGSGGVTGGNRRFDPMSIFSGRDTNKDGRLTAAELAGGPMAERMKQLDKDGDDAISQEEFRSGLSALFSRGRGGSGSYGGIREDTRPTRPQVPKLAN